MKKKDNIKQTFINLAKDHKKNCADKNCVVNLSLLRILLEITGRKLTKKEKEVFW